MNILGISAFYHDSAACLIRDGEIIAAAQEERFTRQKHDSRFPSNAIDFCLKFAKIEFKDVSYVVFYEKPLIKFDRLLDTYLANAPRGFKSFNLALPVWGKEKLFQKRLILESLVNCYGGSISLHSSKLFFSEHHLSHAASAFFPSPFEEAAVLTMDGVGEWTTTSIGYGENSNIKISREIRYPHSLGLLYSAFTEYSGFKVNSGEYKLMGLAPYGKPVYYDLIKNHLIDVKQDGSFTLNMNYFSYSVGTTMTSKKFHKLFSGPPRRNESAITMKEMNLASSIQKVTEEVVLGLAKSVKEEFKSENLCLAGGVALNCVANGKLDLSGLFKNIWIQPAAGDAGGSIGAALAFYHLALNKKRRNSMGKDRMKGGYLGPKFESKEIKTELLKLNAIFQTYKYEDLYQIVANEISAGKAVGWFQGRMEFGPRALGARSILADPRSSTMQRDLNLKIKFRESFRPFAPSVLKDNAKEWFTFKSDSPYMLIVGMVQKSKRIPILDSKIIEFGDYSEINNKRSVIPAVTHLDYSARIQTVNKQTNSHFYGVIREFEKITSCPVLVNTSFNVRGEPIVCSPIDAYNCFMGTDLDILVIGNFFLYKSEQPQSNINSYWDRFELD